MTRVGVDGRELRPGVRSGIRRYLVEVLGALSRAPVLRLRPGTDLAGNFF